LRLTAGYPVLHFERIDSTNSEARRLAEQGERGPLWIVADRQDGGRGRHGRHWVSEPGNLYATLLWPLAGGPEVASQAALVAAVAVHDVVCRLCPGLEPRIKWPNDLLIGGAKFCGILAEVVAMAPTRIAIGCGINVAHAPPGTPYPVTALGAGLAVEQVLQELNISLSNFMTIWDEGQGFAAIREAWAAAALGLGGASTATVGDRSVTGRVAGLAPDGALVLESADGRQHRVLSGDVSFAELEELRRS
jgi:BirA family biotin operon repressor/biotin-[acetyl-CoA-carboxylase] ligase